MRIKQAEQCLDEWGGDELMRKEDEVKWQGKVNTTNILYPREAQVITDL